MTKNQRADVIRIRVNEKERQAFQQAADIAGLSLSAWCRATLRRRAAAEITETGEENPL